MHIALGVSALGHSPLILTCCLRTPLCHVYIPLFHSTGEFQALQLIVLAAFGAVDKPLASCVLVNFLEI